MYKASGGVWRRRRVTKCPRKHCDFWLFITEPAFGKEKTSRANSFERLLFLAIRVKLELRESYSGGIRTLNRFQSIQQIRNNPLIIPFRDSETFLSCIFKRSSNVIDDFAVKDEKSVMEYLCLLNS